MAHQLKVERSKTCGCGFLFFNSGNGLRGSHWVRLFMKGRRWNSHHGLVLPTSRYIEKDIEDIDTHISVAISVQAIVFFSHVLAMGFSPLEGQGPCGLGVIGCRSSI